MSEDEGAQKRRETIASLALALVLTLLGFGTYALLSGYYEPTSPPPETSPRQAKEKALNRLTREILNESGFFGSAADKTQPVLRQHIQACCSHYGCTPEEFVSEARRLHAVLKQTPMKSNLAMACNLISSDRESLKKAVNSLISANSRHIKKAASDGNRH